MRIAGVGHAFPPHYYDQETLLAALEEHLQGRLANPGRLRSLHRNVQVGGRHLALSIPEYKERSSFAEYNDAWIRVAGDLGEQAVSRALADAGLVPEEVGAFFFTSVTGVATPSIEARLMNRLPFSPNMKRIPLFGLGCVAGAAGIARAADYVRALPDEVAVLLSVELCSLTIQREDLSVANLIASGLFGDGAAAVVVTGNTRPSGGPRVIATRSVFYPDSERVMGWDITERGFRIVLSSSVPRVVKEKLGRDVDAFLATNDLTRDQIRSWVCHPGGPKVLEAMQETLGLDNGALALTWKSLNEVGNLSSTSILLVLEETLREQRPEPGSPGMLIAMGPGFCSELVLLEW